MSLYIKSQLADLLVEAAQERSLADVLFLTSLIQASGSELFEAIAGDVCARLILEDNEAYNWLVIDVYNSHKTDEEKAAIAEQVNMAQLNVYKVRNSAGGH